jgi:hypothetical protein
MDYLQQQERQIKDRQAKQDYLVENILKQGYSADEFAQFLSEKKDNGVDVDSWKFSQLQYVNITYRHSF